MTDTGQNHTLFVGQDAIINITVTTSAANIDNWTMVGYWVNKETRSRDMTITATVPTAGQKVARLTITDTDTDALVIPRGKPSVQYEFQFWRTDNGSETPLSTGIATVYRTLRP